MNRALGRPIKGLKIGVPSSYFYDGIADDMNKAVRASLDVLRAQGAEIVEVALPDMDAINALGVLVTLVEAATYHANWMRTRPQDYSDQVRARLESGFAVPGVQYLEALRSRGPVLKNFVETVFGKVDVLHCPSVNAAAPTIKDTDFGGNPAMGKAFAQFTRCARPFNYLGLPTLSLPCGFSAGGIAAGLPARGAAAGGGDAVRGRAGLSGRDGVAHEGAGGLAHSLKHCHPRGSTRGSDASAASDARVKPAHDHLL